MEPIPSLLRRFFDEVKMHPFFQWGPLPLPAYGCFILLGALAAGLYLCLSAAKSGFPREDLIYASLYAAIGVMIGAKLLYVITMLPVLIPRWTLFAEDPKLLLELFRGGFVFYGGFLGGVFGVWRYGRRYRLPFLPLTDQLIIAVPLVHGFGRIGCFFAGCCYGIPYEGFGAVVYPENSFGLSGVSLFPLPLVEAMGLFLLFLVLALLSRKPRKIGFMTGIYLCAYAVFRFILEFFRYDDLRGVWFGLSTSQYIGILLFAAGCVLLWTSKKRGTFTRGENVI